MLMAARRLSKLQRQILSSMWTQYERTQGGISTGHLELVQTLGRDKSNVSHSLRTLEARGFITIGRTAGGQATYLDLTSEGRKLASKLVKSCDQEI
jgi:DNA-binding MarR family transcriptional regulator